MNRYMLFAVTVLLVAAQVFAAPAFGQQGAGQDAEEMARRHILRGVAAIEMAKSDEDLAAAAAEFKKACEIAPNMALAWYNLGTVQKKTGDVKGAIESYRRYVSLAPTADNVQEVKDEIVKLEYKAEQILTVADITAVLGSFLGYTMVKQGCNPMFFGIRPNDSQSIKVMSSLRYYPVRENYQVLKVTGPVVKYVATVNVCDDQANRQLGGCDSIVEHEIEVVSRTLVRVNQRVLRGGDGAGVRTGQTFSCTFQKK